MKIHRNKKPVNTGRQRLRTAPAESERKLGAFVYRGRGRDEVESPNTGRQIQRQAAKAARHGMQRVGVIVLVLAVLFSLIKVLSLSTTPKIISLASDNHASIGRDNSQYERAASAILSQSIWNRNKVTVDTNGVTRQLMKQYPELSSASMTLPLLAQRPLIYIEPARAAFTLIASNGTFVISDQGKALLQVESQGNELPTINDQSGLKLELGKTAVPEAHVAFIEEVIAQLDAKQISIDSLTLPSAASELDVKIAGQPYFVKFNLQSNKPRQQAGTYLATIDELKKKNITPREYVDVRVEARAYYK